MKATLATHLIDYISIWDPAVDDEAMPAEDIGKYLANRDRGLLRFKQDAQPVIWQIAPLTPYQAEWAREIAPKHPDGRLIPSTYYYHLCEVGLRSAKHLPDDAPKLATYQEGHLTRLVPEFMGWLPADLARDIGYAVHQESTVDEDLKKKSCSPSDGPRSKGDCTVEPARSE
jgi:hypothetical protein